MKSWRDGGKYPVVPFEDLRSILIHGYNMSYNQLRYVWGQIMIETEATSSFSSSLTLLPPVYSMIEEVQNLIEILEETNAKINWWEIPALVLNLATPANWGFIHFKSPVQLQLV